MKTKKAQQNLIDARRYFNIDLSRDLSKKYAVHHIDDEMFNRGMHDGSQLHIESIPENMKNNSSYVAGFDRAKRILKIQADLYNMGKDYFLNSGNINDVPVNYRNNEYFMQGYNDAKNMEFVEDKTIRHSGR